MSMPESDGLHPHGRAPGVPAGARRRVCFFLNSWTYGGVEAHVALLCARLPALGYDPIVVCSELDALRPLYRQLDVLGVGREAFQILPGALGKVRSIVRLTELLRSERVDLAHVQLIFSDGGRVPVLSARLAGIPVVVTHHAAQRTAFASRLARRPLLALVSQFIAVSSANRADQIRDMSLPATRLTAVHNGIVVAEQAPDRRTAHFRLTTELGLPAETKLVGGVGRLSEQKGFDALLEATVRIAQAMPQVHVVLVGDGPCRARLEGQAARLGIERRVSFLGFRSDTPEVLNAIDVLAMPSLFEGLPLVLVEAFAAGCPVVANAVDGIPEVVDDGVNGFLVPRGNVDLLAARIVDLLKDDALSERVGRAARQKALSAFTADRMAGNTVAVYDRVLGGTAEV
jgi:glycosyltransferase involved in cell wall biosynthesis